MHNLTQELLLKRKAQSSRPPGMNWFLSAGIILFFTKQAPQKRRSTVLSLLLQLVFPGYGKSLYYMHDLTREPLLKQKAQYS
jgi:hypothetical protein